MREREDDLRLEALELAHNQEVDTETVLERARAYHGFINGGAAPGLTDDQVKHMVERFLSWKLPESFSPDAGISFKPTFNYHMDPPMRHNPTGTNLFDYTQAEAMVRHMAEGLSANG